MANPAFASAMDSHTRPRNSDILGDVWDGEVWKEQYTDDPKMSKHHANFMIILSTDGKYCRHSG